MEEAKDKTDARLYCGFCGKPGKDVAKLIEGPETHICNECVATCVSVLCDGSQVRNVEFQHQNPLIPETHVRLKCLKAAALVSAAALNRTDVQLGSTTELAEIFTAFVLATKEEG